MRLRTALPAGGVLLASVVAWRLTRGSFADDVATICDAEARSGFTLRRDMPALTAWVTAHLATPSGAAFYASLRDVPMAERAARLRLAASPLRVAQAGQDDESGVAEAPCAIAASYDALGAYGAYRADVQHLCSRIDLPLDDLDEALRLQVLEEWIALHAESHETARLGQSLSEAPLGLERAGVLAAAARSLDILSCENARTLEHPSPAQPGIWPRAGM